MSSRAVLSASSSGMSSAAAVRGVKRKEPQLERVSLAQLRECAPNEDPRLKFRMCQGDGCRCVLDDDFVCPNTHCMWHLSGPQLLRISDEDAEECEHRGFDITDQYGACGGRDAGGSCRCLLNAEGCCLNPRCSLYCAKSQTDDNIYDIYDFAGAPERSKRRAESSRSEGEEKKQLREPQLPEEVRLFKKMRRYKELTIGLDLKSSDALEAAEAKRPVAVSASIAIARELQADRRTPVFLADVIRANADAKESNRRVKEVKDYTRYVSVAHEVAQVVASDRPIVKTLMTVLGRFASHVSPVDRLAAATLFADFVLQRKCAIPDLSSQAAPIQEAVGVLATRYAPTNISDTSILAVTSDIAKKYIESPIVAIRPV